MADGNTTYSQTLGSIVIPAHNEAASIERCLRALLVSLDPGKVQIVVACNGCTDNTAAIARAVDTRLIVLDLPAPGKIAAIRAAEQVATQMPRIYLDADIVMTGRAAAAVLGALASGAIAARPPIEFDVEGCSWLLRRFWATKLRLENVMGDLCGGGAYGLSATARARFGEFPDISGDDLFVSRIVKQDEIVVVPTDPLVVRPPRDLRSQLRVLKRTYRGNREFAARFPQLNRDTTSESVGGLLRLLRNPANWIDTFSYASIVLIGRIWSRLDSNSSKWERDESAR